MLHWRLGMNCQRDLIAHAVDCVVLLSLPCNVLHNNDNNNHGNNNSDNSTLLLRLLPAFAGLVQGLFRLVQRGIS